MGRKEHKVTWSAGAQFDVAPDVMVYALAATGDKTGGFNARSAAAGVPVEFGPEETTTYEAGVKSVLLDRKLVLNADIYTMKLKQFQDSILNPLTGSGFIVANAGDRRVRGFEADAQYRPIDPLSFKASVSYMDGEFTDYSAGQCNVLKPANGTKPGTCNYNGLTPSADAQVELEPGGQLAVAAGRHGPGVVRHRRHQLHGRQVPGARPWTRAGTRPTSLWWGCVWASTRPSRGGGSPPTAGT